METRIATLNLQINNTQAERAAETFLKVLGDIEAAAKRLDLSAAFKGINVDVARAVQLMNQFTTTMGGGVASVLAFSNSLSGNLKSSIGAPSEGLKNMASGINSLANSVKKFEANGLAIQSFLVNLTSLLVAASGITKEAVDNFGKLASAVARMYSAFNAGTAPSGKLPFFDPAQTRSALNAMDQFLNRLTRLVQLVNSLSTDAAKSFSQVVSAASRFSNVINPPNQVNRLPFFNPGGQNTPTNQNLPGAQQLNTTATQTTQTVNALGKAIAGAKVEKDKLDKNMQETAAGSLKDMYHGLRTLQGLFAAFTIVALIREFRSWSDELLDTARQLQHIRALFSAAAGGNVDEADRLQAVAKGLANEFGTPVLALQENIAKLAGAARGTSVEGDKLNTVFRGVSAAVGVLGTGSEKATNIVKVFTDILSKGRVQSEEVVKQFGNAIPGAYRIVANALGKTTQELSQALQRGTVTIGEVIPKVAAELLKIYGDIAKAQPTTIIGSFNLFKNAIVELKEAILLGGAEAGFIEFFRGLAAVLTDQSLLVSAREIGEIFGAVLVYAMQALGFAIRFVSDHWRAFASILAAGSIIATLGTLATTVGLVALAFGQIGGVVVTVGLAIVGVIAALGAYFGLFAGIGKDAAEALQKFQQHLKDLQSLPSPFSDVELEKTRAYNDALEVIGKEMRTFKEDIRDQAVLLDLNARGVSTLSAEYEAYAKALTRVRALERRGVFQAFGEDAAKARQDAQEQFIALESIAKALEHVTKAQKELHQAQQDTRVAGLSAGTARNFGGGLTQESLTLQEEYDKKIIPALLRAQEIIKTLHDPAQIHAMAQSFNAFSLGILAALTSLRQMTNELKAIGGVVNTYQNFRTTQAMNMTLTRGEGTRELVTPESTESLLQRYMSNVGVDRFGARARVLGSGGVGGDAGKLFSEAYGRLAKETQAPLVKFTDTFGEHVKKFGEAVDKMSGKVSSGVDVVGATAYGAVDVLAKSGPYRAQIERQAGRIRFDPELMARMISTESSFNPKAEGSSGEIGLSQFMPANRVKYNLTNPRDPNDSIRAMADLLKDLMVAFKGDIHLVVAAYNAGQGAVEKAGNKIPNIDVTQQYVRTVLGGYTGTGVGATGQMTPDQTETKLLERGNEKIYQDWLASEKALSAKMQPLPESLVPYNSGNIRLSKLGLRTFGMFYPELNDSNSELRKALEKQRRASLPVSTDAEARDAIEKKRYIYDDITENVYKPRYDTRQKEIADAANAKKNIDAMRIKTDAQAVAGAQKQYEQPLVPETESQTMKDIIALTQIRGNTQLTQEGRQEREIAIISAVEAKRKELGVTDKEWSDKSLISLNNWIILTAEASAANAVFYDHRVKQGEDYVQLLGRENEDIRTQIKLLDVAPALRQVEADAIKRRIAARVGGGFTTESVAKETEAQLRVAKELQDKERSSTAFDAMRKSLHDSNIDLRTQLDLLQKEPLAREIAAVSMQHENQMIKDHWRPEDIERGREAIKVEEALRKAVQDATGPLRQFQDAADTAFTQIAQTTTVNVFQGLTDQLVNFVTTGKASFKDFANVIIGQIIRIATQKGFAELLKLIPGTTPTGSTSVVPSATTTTFGGESDFAHGGIVGIDAGGRINIPSYMFTNAPRYQFGGTMGTDTYPAMLTPGEGVFTQAQMAKLAPANRGGGDVHVHMTVVTPDADSFRKSQSQILTEVTQASTLMNKRLGNR